MNSTEQRQHRTVTQDLDKRLEDAEVVIIRLLEQDKAMQRAGEALAARVAMCEDRAQMDREYATRVQQELECVELIATRHVAMTLWQRLRWLVRGV